MSDNSFAPPKAALADHELVPGDRPVQVTRAAMLYGVQYVISIISMTMTWEIVRRLQPGYMIIGGRLFTLLVMAFLCSKILAGRNWARILVLIFTMLAFLGVVALYVTPIYAGIPLVSKIVMSINPFIGACMCWLLFTSPGREWFRPR